MKVEGQVRIPSGCAIAAVISRDGNRITGERIINAMKPMHERSNGLGGGFAGYGIYPEYKDFYALHLFFNERAARKNCETFLKERFEIVQTEIIPTRKIPSITDEPIIWRYFVAPLQSALISQQLDEKEFVVRTVMKINTEMPGSYVFSSGKNMGTFKAVGFPEDVGVFYKLDEYEGYSWTAHGRYPTNTPGWWGGAHPFTLLDYSIVHNGEISSYDANRRFIEMFGYTCTLQTDTEVITYIMDYLTRAQGLTLEEAANVIAAPFWSTIETKKDETERKKYAYLRTAFSSLLVTGPFSIVLGFRGGLMALNDRLKLRSMVVGEKDDMVFIASEEAAIRTMEPAAENISAPRWRRTGHYSSKGRCLLMGLAFISPEFEVVRNDGRCTRCRICERQCANEAHAFDLEHGVMVSDETRCVNCQRCVSFCPTRALKIVKNDNSLRENANWGVDTVKEIYKQADSGGVLLSSMGSPSPLPVYWDRILINASQVTNPPIDPLREPMETRVFLGKKPDRVQRGENGELLCDLPPQLELSMPVMFSAMSYGSISYNAHASLARAAKELGIYYNTGEGGLHEDFYCYGENTIVQVASGRFGVYKDYLETGAAVEIKMGQGAKPGIGGHLPGATIVGDVSRTRMIPEGSDAISSAPHHDIYSIEDLRQLVFSLKEATEYAKPVIVKVAAVHNIAAIASGIARSGADIIAIDGFRGGTGAAPTRIRDNVGIPIELALAAVDQRPVTSPGPAKTVRH